MKKNWLNIWRIFDVYAAGPGRVELSQVGRAHVKPDAHHFTQL